MLLNFYCENKSKIVYIALLALLIVSQSFTLAQTGTLKGVVSDKTTKEVLVGANVIVRGTNLGAAADIDGNYIIHNISAGSHVLDISYVGYKNLSINIKVVANKVSTLDINLEPEAIQGKVVTVTAQAAGQLQAINEQLSSSNIINVVSTQKMQELPDANIAESIGRLPGISVTRNNGEANEVVVRGLAPQFNEVTIEGVPMASTAFYGRDIDLSILSDNLVKSVEVSKTLQPDMDANALGGTINLTLNTAAPGLNYNLSGYGAYTDLRYNTNNYKFLGGISDRFLDDKLGVLLQGDVEEKQLPSDQLSANYTVSHQGSLFSFTSQNAILTDNNVKRFRFGASLVLDYQTDLVSLKFLNIFDEKRDSTRQNQYQTNFNAGFTNYVNINETITMQETHSLQALFKIAGTELPVSVSYTKSTEREPYCESFFFQQPTSGVLIPPTQLLFGQPYALIKEQLSYQNDTANYLNDANVTNQSLVDESYDARADYKVPFKLSDAFSGTLSAGAKLHYVDRNNEASYLDAYLGYGLGTPLRDAIVQEYSYLNSIPGYAVTVHKDESGQDLPAFPFVASSGYRTSILGYPIGKTYNNYALSNILTWLSTVPKSILPTPYFSLGPNDYNQNYGDKENSYEGYVMGQFNVGNDLSLVAGARYQDELTDISAFHAQVNPSNPDGLQGTPYLDEAKRENVLWYPSLNVKEKVNDNVQVVGAAYESESLPAFYDICPAIAYNMGNTSITTAPTTPGSSATVGFSNPILKPSTAWNFDLGVSWFNNQIGLLTANVFYKDLSNLVTYVGNYYPFGAKNPTPAALAVLNRLPSPSYYDPQWNIIGTGDFAKQVAYIPMNDPNQSYLRGIELSWQTHFWYLPGVLSGLVFDFNASLMNSSEMYHSFESVTVGKGSAAKTSIDFISIQGPLQNQPNAIYNAVLGWDYKGFSARVSYQDQKASLYSLDVINNQENQYTGDVTLWDVSLKQQILEHFSIFGDATNINKHVDNTYYSYPTYVASNGNIYNAGNVPVSDQFYGMILQLGISYTF
jgi:TonB-dependent receptor